MVLKKIEDTACEANWRWNVKKDYDNWENCKFWNINDYIMLV